jgi:hypothetical protein
VDDVGVDPTPLFSVSGGESVEFRGEEINVTGGRSERTPRASQGEKRQREKAAGAWGKCVELPSRSAVRAMVE